MGGKSRNPEIWVIRRSVIKVVPGYCFQTKFSGTKGCILASLWPPTESYFTNLDICEIFGVPFPLQKAVIFGAFRSCRVRSWANLIRNPSHLLCWWNCSWKCGRKVFLWRLRSDKYNNYIYMYVYIQCWLLSYTVAVAVAIRILTILVGNLYWPLLTFTCHCYSERVHLKYVSGGPKASRRPGKTMILTVGLACTR